MQPVQPTSGGTLHVLTEIVIDNNRKVSLEKAVPQGINPLILMLNFIESRTDQFVENPQEVRYSDQLQAKGQHTSVELRFHGDLLTTIEEIQIVH